MKSRWIAGIGLLLLALAGTAPAQEMPGMMEILEGLRRREALLPRLQGAAVQRVRTPGPVTLLLDEPEEENRSPHITSSATERTYAKTESKVALRFWLGEGVVRYDVWRLQPSFMTVAGRPPADVDEALLPDTVQTVATAQNVTSYTSSLRMATVMPQRGIPSVFTGLLAQPLMINVGGHAPSVMLEHAMRAHGLLPPRAEGEPEVRSEVVEPPVLLGERTIAGAACVGVDATFQSMTPGMLPVRMRFWVEPAHGMSLRAVEYQYQAEPEHDVSARRVVFLALSDVEVAPGLWVPDVVSITTWHQRDPNGAERMGEFESWAFTSLSVAPLAADTFVLNLPPGTRVVDRYHGGEWVGGLSPERIRQLEDAMPDLDPAEMVGAVSNR